MAFTTKYNQTYSAPVTITDEAKVNAGSGANYVGYIPRAFKGGTNFVIRTASGGGGTLLVEGTDYTLTEDTVKSAVAGFAVYYRYTITNVTYQTGTIYISYKSLGSYAYAENSLSLTGGITAEGSLIIDTSVFVVSSLTDRVMIGATSGEYIFTVHGGADAAYTHYVNTSSGVGAADGCLVGMSASKNFILYNNEATTTIIGDSSSPVRINASGQLGLGKAPAYQLELSTDSAGKPSTNTWTVVSDKRTKDNIEFADLDICYNTIKNLPLKRWTWKDEIYSVDKVKDRSKIGWVADDVETVFPKAVGKHDFYKDRPEDAGEDYEDEILIPDCKNLNSDQIIAAMYGAIQKLQIMVEGLK